MSKVINVNIGKWNGSVTLADPLTISQAKLIEEGNKPSQFLIDLYQKIKDTREQCGDDSPELKKLLSERFSLWEYDDGQLPAVITCVEKWELPNFPDRVTLDNFPASPRGASHELIAFVFGKINEIYFGEAEVPNA